MPRSDTRQGAARATREPATIEAQSTSASSLPVDARRETTRTTREALPRRFSPSRCSLWETQVDQGGGRPASTVNGIPNRQTRKQRCESCTAIRLTAEENRLPRREIHARNPIPDRPGFADGQPGSRSSLSGNQNGPGETPVACVQTRPDRSCWPNI